MNEAKQLLPMEAWKDFWDTVRPILEEVPNELHVAQTTWRGNARHKNGSVKTLGAARVKRLLDKYAPGRYQFHQKEWVIKNEQ